MRTLRTDANRCEPMLANDSRCLPMLTDVYQCLPMLTAVFVPLLTGDDAGKLQRIIVSLLIVS
jgi:hypothetical protein